MRGSTTHRPSEVFLLMLLSGSLFIASCSNEAEELKKQNQELQAQIDELKSTASLVASTDPAVLLGQLTSEDQALFEYWQSERLNLINLRDVLEEFEDRVAASEQFEYLFRTIHDAVTRQSSLKIVERIPEIRSLAANWGSIYREYEEFTAPQGERFYCTLINGQGAIEQVFGDGPVPEVEEQDCSFPLRRGIDHLIQDLNSFKIWIEETSAKFDRLLR